MESKKDILITLKMNIFLVKCLMQNKEHGNYRLALLYT